MPIAAQLAATHRAELVLAHVVAVPELMRSGLPTAEDRSLERAVIERNESAARRYLEEIRLRVQHPRFQAHTYLSRKGNPREESLPKPIRGIVHLLFPVVPQLPPQLPHLTLRI